MSDFQGDHRFSCPASQKTCKHDVDFPEGAEECVKLDGTLFDGPRVGHVLIRTSARVCASDGESTAEVTSLSFLPGEFNKRRHLWPGRASVKPLLPW